MAPKTFPVVWERVATVAATARNCSHHVLSLSLALLPSHFDLLACLLSYRTWLSSLAFSFISRDLFSPRKKSEKMKKVICETPGIHSFSPKRKSQSNKAEKLQQRGQREILAASFFSLVKSAYLWLIRCCHLPDISLAITSIYFLVSINLFVRVCLGSPERWDLWTRTYILVP